MNITNFETDFRRIYGELYPVGADFSRVLREYKWKYPHLELSDVRLDLDFPKLFDLAEECKVEPWEIHRIIQFKDIKNLIGDQLLDILYLSPRCATQVYPLTFYPEQFKLNLGKCISGCKNNNINIGNFKELTWNKGVAIRDLRDIEISKGIFCGEAEGYLNMERFTSSGLSEEINYKYPLLIVMDKYNEGNLIQDFFDYLRIRKKIILDSGSAKPKNFLFVGKNFGDAKGTNIDSFILDELKWLS